MEAPERKTQKKQKKILLSQCGTSAQIELVYDSIIHAQLKLPISFLETITEAQGSPTAGFTFFL